MAVAIIDGKLYITANELFEGVTEKVALENITYMEKIRDYFIKIVTKQKITKLGHKFNFFEKKDAVTDGVNENEPPASLQLNL